MKYLLLAISIFSSFYVQANKALLTPEALGCFEAVMDERNADVLENAKKYATVDMEKIAIGLCTYSNAKGALKCLRDAKKDSQVLPSKKEFVSIVGLDRDYARLCSNSRIVSHFPANKDVDAIECFKAVMKDPEVFTQRKGNPASELEKEVIDLCISSNGKGATTCFKNAMAEKVRLFGSSIDYKTRSTLESTIGKLCRGTRL